MKGQKFLSVMITGIFMLSMVAFPITSSANMTSAVDEMTLEAKTQIKADFLNHLADMYNKVVALSEAEIHGMYLDELFSQEKRILETVATLEDDALRNDITNTVTARMTEIKEKIQSLSKAQILENLLVAQEELSHLGVEQVAKSFLALLASFALAPVFVAGVVVAGAGILLRPVDLITFGYFPLGGVLFLGGVLIAAGSFTGAAMVWIWASE